MANVLILAEPRDRIETKHAQQFYAELLNIVTTLGLEPVITHYSHSPAFAPEQAPILICHGTIAAEYRKKYAPAYSILLGERSRSGFNTCLHNILDNTLGASHPGVVKPNPYHFIMDPTMISKLKTALLEAKKTIEPNSNPSPVSADSPKPIQKSASGLFSYSVNPTLFQGHTLDDYQRMSVGHVYPSLSQQSIVRGSVIKPALYQALEAHADWKKHQDERSKVRTMMALGDMIGYRYAAALDSAPESKAVVGKIDHALDKFRHEDLALAEHVGVVVNSAKQRGIDHNQAEAIATMLVRDNNPMMKAAAAERDLELWHQWNKSKDPEHLSMLMTQISPLLINETNKWQQTGINRAILDGKARTLAYEAITSYDPSKSQLNTHVINHMQKLNRFAIANQNAVRIQEEKIFQYRKFLHEKNALEDRLGRPASPDELKAEIAKMGNGTLLKDFKPIIENYYSAASEAGGAPVMEELSSDATALHLAMNAMNDRQKFIFQHSYGFNKAPVMSNAEIAKHYGVSSAMISKQKRNIDHLVKEHVDASRYLLSSI